MNEPKTFASLSSGLLARKGAARPAMRPQGFGQVGAAGLDDLGWNDMGFEAPKPALTPVRDEDHDAFGEEVAQPVRNPLSALTPASPVHHQQAEIADRFAVGENEEAVDEDYDDTAEPYEPEAAVESAEAEEEVAEVAEVVPFVAPEPVVEVAAAPAPVVSATPRRPARPRAAPGSHGKAAFTLRLDPARHLKLRLACAVSGRSAQMMVTEALDALLSEMPGLDSMAEQAPPRKKAAGR